MKLRDYLMNISTEELTDRLIYLDKAIMDLKQQGKYYVGDLSDIEIINNEVTIDSFKNKYDYLESGYNINGDYDNIIQLCAIGICAYNKLSVLHTSKEFINYVIENVEMFLEHGNIPNFMQEYYINVFNRGKIEYLNTFLSENNFFEKEGQSQGKGKGAYTKSTAIGRAMVDKDSAFASVLILPAMLALVYISVVVIYFVFFYNGG